MTNLWSDSRVRSKSWASCLLVLFISLYNDASRADFVDVGIVFVYVFVDDAMAAVIVALIVSLGHSKHEPM